VRHYDTQFFCSIKESTGEASTPTRGGDAFGTELAKNQRFLSLGLNLAFEGLLLGRSLQPRVKGTHSEPHELSFLTHDTFIISDTVSTTFL
jgi:hypothetical protein